MGKYAVTVNDKGSYHFNLLAKNKEPILTSQMYKAKRNALKGVESVKKNAPTAPVEDQTVKDYEKVKAPRFEIFQGKDNKFYFRLVAANSQPIGRSEGYNSKTSCKNGIESVRKNADSEVEFTEKK